MTKKEEKQVQKIKSKEELLSIMNEHLATQQKFAEILKQKAEKFISDETLDKDGKKNRNSYLNAYNVQVDAVSRTSKTMINIFNSSLENGEEEEYSDSLVD